MPNIEKTVFISYRRKNGYEALAVYQHLTSQQYDVFLDYTSIPSGDFEQIIVSNIKARAHFVLILTPTALDRCSQPNDWLRREIETAIDEKRNIIPLFFDDFSFGAPDVVEKLSGKLGAIRRYNGLEIPAGYFHEAMERLRERYLNIPLNAVIHPVSTEVRKAVEEQKNAANEALGQKKESIEVLIKPAAPKLVNAKGRMEETSVASFFEGALGKFAGKGLNNGLSFIGKGLVILLVLGFAFNSIAHNNTPLEIPAPIGTTMTSEKDDMILLYVPAGEFVMGSGHEENNPMHTVYLDAFSIDQTEVTNAMYANCDENGPCDAPSNNIHYHDPNYADHPVVFVSWIQANTYCTWAGRRLPTEAEWEKAARGTDGRTYPWDAGESPSSTLLNYANIVGNTTEVGEYPDGASPYGALDMAGNVWEWVADWYSDAYYAISPQTNPLGPPSGADHVYRGGTWASDASEIRSTYRKHGKPTNATEGLGFRCANSP